MGFCLLTRLYIKWTNERLNKNCHYFISYFRFYGKRDAEDACHCMNGRMLDGRDLVCNIVDSVRNSRKRSRSG